MAADAAQAAADAFNTAEPVVRKAATAAAQTATDVANAAAGAYHKAEPVARKAALEALQTGNCCGQAGIGGAPAWNGNVSVLVEDTGVQCFT